MWLHVITEQRRLSEQCSSWRVLLLLCGFFLLTSRWRLEKNDARGPTSVTGDALHRQSLSAALFTAVIDAKVIDVLAWHESRNSIWLWLVWTLNLLNCFSNLETGFICKRWEKTTWWCIRGPWRDWDRDPRTNQSRQRCWSHSCPARGTRRQTHSTNY